MGIPDVPFRPAWTAGLIRVLGPMGFGIQQLFGTHRPFQETRRIISNKQPRTTGYGRSLAEVPSLAEIAIHNQ